MGATIGRQFAYELLQTVSQLDASTLQWELGRLVEAEIVYQRGLPPQATYTFKHALIQDAAYQSLLKSTRQQYHQRITQVLEEQFPETIEAQPELVAQHCMAAGLTNHAVPYWYKAAQHAVERSAHVEAISHLRQGLALLQTLPETPERTQQALPLHIALGVSLAAIKSYAASEVQQTYTRAHQLCQHLDNPPQLFLVLRGLWNCHHVRAEHQTAYERGEQFLALARQVQDAAMLMAAYRSLGSTLFMRGAVAAAHTHFAQGIALYDPQQHRAAAFRYGEDAGVLCQIYAALALWYLGYPEQGRMRLDDALILAQQSSHAFSLGFTLSMAAIFHQLRREVRCTQERAEAAISLATEQGFPHWRAMGCLLRGWALTHQGQAQEGIEQITTSMMDYRATGAALLRPYFLGLLTETHSVIGQPEAGLTVLREALALVDTTGEHWYEPELYRLKGELLLQQSLDHQAEAENCFQQAISIAQNQQAKSLELCAARSLSKLWHSQGKRQEAHDLLAPVYGWFTEGFDTADLQEAKALMETLA
jgi:predicted ATPase